MRVLTKIFAGGVGLAALAAAAPASAQYYPSTPYGYGYGSQGGLGAIIDQLLGGNRYAYGVDQRTLVNQCVAAVTDRIQRTYSYNRYGYPYGQGAYGAYGYANSGASARVLGITDISRGDSRLRIRGVATANGNVSAYGSPYGGYGSPYGTYGSPYGNTYGYGQQMAELQFKCDVDYRGRIRDIDLNRNNNAYQYYRR